MMTVGEAYALSGEEYPNVKIGRVTFSDLRPLHVCLNIKFPHNVCLCKYHENMRLLLSSLKSCIPVIPMQFKEFLATIVCDQGSESCMIGRCQDCQNRFKDVYSLDDEVCKKIVTWWKWKTADQSTVKCEQRGTVNEVVAEVVKQHPYFKQHTFIKRKQAECFEDKRKSVNGRNAVVQLQVECAEKYMSVEQDEIQSAHWNHSQVTLFTVCMDR